MYQSLEEKKGDKLKSLGKASSEGIGPWEREKVLQMGQP